MLESLHQIRRSTQIATEHLFTFSCLLSELSLIAFSRICCNSYFQSIKKLASKTMDSYFQSIEKLASKNLPLIWLLPSCRRNMAESSKKSMHWWAKWGLSNCPRNWDECLSGTQKMINWYMQLKNFIVYFNEENVLNSFYLRQKCGIVRVSTMVGFGYYDIAKREYWCFVRQFLFQWNETELYRLRWFWHVFLSDCEKN